MQYLIITSEKESFFTKWFDFENNYQEGMIIVDFINLLISYDGETWDEIKEDHL